jgi:hypothetical protein
MIRRLDWRGPALAAALLLFLFCWWHWSHWREQTRIAAGFGARIACSCRLVEGRDLESCRSDFARLSGMEWVHLSDRADGRGVDAGVPLMAHRSARLVAGFGCLMEPS